MVLAATLALALPVTASASGQVHCGHIDRLTVPGAQRAEHACLDDLTTTGTVAGGHTVQADWTGLTSAGLPVPSGVPGVQVDGYFPDTSTTNNNHGWAHDAQFVIRMPDHWNGGLVVTGSPGNRAQYANDRAIGDQVLADGFAFAATDKGNVGTKFYDDGSAPGDSVAEWNLRVTQLTLAAKAVVWQRYGRLPSRTIAAGLSNGGYLVRWQLENVPWLYDGGVDWEGTLFTEQGPNLMTFLPPAIKNYPAYAAGDENAHQALLDDGFAPGSEFLWPFHNQVYWTLTQQIYRAEFDPGYTGSEADYDYASRPAAVHRAVGKVSLTGRIDKPLITIHGTLDSLLPIAQDSDVYDRMITDAGRGALHRYYRFAGGNHVDGLVDAYPDRLRPLAPCFRSAFSALTGWLGGTQPPPSSTITAVDKLTQSTSCSLVD
ncbi:3HB-oligomer hydrolase 3HBOH [Labedaea rhizosphaerae]|uniref:3HB-oligomer hydrolase 3HBOH n=1 Tax=Labedaea rhizosphaerae TaxID=598644 RepID=A0A4R6SMM3_LABRH|nr:3HB-oligomer hydrolase 3HBOH [Labedaea rhizosphaerae]